MEQSTSLQTWLQQSPLLAGLSAAECGRLIAGGEKLAFAFGEVILPPGPADALYLLLSGSARQLQPDSEGDMEVSRRQLRPGDLFGIGAPDASDGGGGLVRASESTSVLRIAAAELPGSGSGLRSCRRLQRRDFVAQIDETDCGVAALAMVCRQFNRRVNLARLRQLSGTAAGGIGTRGLCRAAAAAGLNASAVRYPPGDPSRLTAPAIAHWDGNHWVAVTELDRQVVRIADPARGLRALSLTAFAEHWNGVAVLCSDTDAPPSPPPTTPGQWLVAALPPLHWSLLLLILLTVGICVLQLLLPLLTMVVVDDILAVHDHQLLNTVAAALGLSICLTLLLTLLQRRVLSSMTTSVDQAVADRIVDRLLSLPLLYFANRESGDIRRRLESGRAIRDLIAKNLTSSVLACVQLLAFLTAMVWLHADLAMIYLIQAPVYVLLLYFSGKLLRPAFGAQQLAEVRVRELEDDIVSGIEDVKTAAAEAYVHRAIRDGVNSVSAAQTRDRFNIHSYEGTVQALGLLSAVLFIWLGARLVMAGELTLGAFVAFLILIAMCYGPIAVLLNLWEDLQLSSILFARLDDLLQAHPESYPTTADPGPVRGSVAVQDVSFRYSPDAPPALRHVTMRIAPGTHVAIVGRSGSGKTTLAKCLATVVIPDSGEVYFDDRPLKEFDRKALRRQIGVVLQDNHVFTGTVAENIAFGDSQPSPDRIEWAARAAALDDFIQRLPHGYATELGGSSGAAMSAARRQCLALARVFYQHPVIYILDEATSSLDAETQRTVRANLDQLLEGRTAFFVTHRPATARQADMIIVLDQGRVVEQGSHDALVAQRGLYYHLYAHYPSEDD